MIIQNFLGVQNLSKLFCRTEKLKQGETAASAKLDNAYCLAFKPKKWDETGEEDISKYSETIQEAVKLIKEELIYKLAILKNGKKGIFAEFFLKYPGGLLAEYELLKKQLIIIAKKSDITAKFIIDLFKEKGFSFSFATQPAFKALGFKKYTYAGHIPEYKTIVIPLQMLKSGEINPIELQDMLTHECIHAVDDLLKKNLNPQCPAYLSETDLRAEIKPMLYKELEKTKALFKGLKILRVSKITKRIRKKNPSATGEEIMKEVKADFKKRPIYRIDKKQADEVDIVKKNTWCWHEPQKGIITVPLISYIEEGYDPFKTNDLSELIIEYFAYGVDFFLSGDKTKQDRLRDFDFTFRDYIGKVVYTMQGM